MVPTDVIRTPRSAASVDPASQPPAAASPGSTRRWRAPRSAALLSIVAGVWAATIAYAGPSVGFSMGSAPGWQWTLDRAVLHLLPGVVAVVSGAVLLRKEARWAAIAVMVAGAWAVLGPDAWPVVHSSGTGRMGTGMGMGGMAMSQAATGADLSRTIAYHSGPGVMLLMAGGWAFGHVLRRCPD